MFVSNLMMTHMMMDDRKDENDHDDVDVDVERDGTTRGALCFFGIFPNEETFMLEKNLKCFCVNLIAKLALLALLCKLLGHMT